MTENVNPTQHLFGWRKVLVAVLAWGALNVIALFLFSKYEQSVLEKKHELRSGILSEFAAEKVVIQSASGESTEVNYRVFSPPDHKPNERLPLVLYLHGAGERGSDNAAQLRAVPSLLTDVERRAKYRSVILVPQCPRGMNWEQFRQAGNSDEDLLLRALNDAIAKYGVDRTRIYLIGYSMGSFGAWQMAADNPKRFAATVPISGGGPESLSVNLTETPVWAVHGADDGTCSVEATRALVQCIRDKGGACRYTELAGVGHGAWKPAFLDSDEILDWMFRQIRSKLNSSDTKS